VKLEQNWKADGKALVFYYNGIVKVIINKHIKCFMYDNKNDQNEMLVINLCYKFIKSHNEEIDEQL